METMSLGAPMAQAHRTTPESQAGPTIRSFSEPASQPYSLSRPPNANCQLIGEATSAGKD